MQGDLLDGIARQHFDDQEGPPSMVLANSLGKEEFCAALSEAFLVLFSWILDLGGLGLTI